MNVKTIGIIGAGIAGIACARRLTGGGAVVRLFDKARSVGGRMATRRVETPAGPAQFDLGAQYVTARTQDFASELDTCASEGAAAVWPVEIVARGEAGRGAARAEPIRVGRPGMSWIARALSRRLDVIPSTRIDGVERTASGWMLHAEDGALHGPFDAVIIAVPAEQAAPLLEPIAPTLAGEARSARTAPCWAGLYAFADPLIGAPPAIRFAGHPVLGWTAFDNSKPGRAQGPACFVVHANADWSRRHLEETPESMAPLLLAALKDALKIPSAPVFAKAHRWRYAQVETPAGTPFSWDADRAIGVCGDWRLGARVELAWRSGHELAGAVLACA